MWAMYDKYIVSKQRVLMTCEADLNFYQHFSFPNDQLLRRLPLLGIVQSLLLDILI